MSTEEVETAGYAGLENQGTICYMNSLLQTLYHIPLFRKYVYLIPTTDDGMPSESTPLALQSLFYQMQSGGSGSVASTEDLTKSFGWDKDDCLYDIQEFNFFLCAKLEDRMRGTDAEGTMQWLFEGHHMNYIECINVDYKSTTKESFRDLQLHVEGCRNVYDSFDKYVEVELLKDDNKYRVEQHGAQEARKGVLFINFPPVLQLHLKRSYYDLMLGTMVKINDYYEFPLQLDLDRDNGKYLSPKVDRSVRNLYTLYSVLGHSGGVHSGHYNLYIRPTLSNSWFNFDDQRVTKEDGEELALVNMLKTNARMLVYIRDSDRDVVFCKCDLDELDGSLLKILEDDKSHKELEKKEKNEAHIYTIVKLAQEEDLVAQIGNEIWFDLVDHDKVLSFRIKNQRQLSDLKVEEIRHTFGEENSVELKLFFDRGIKIGIVLFVPPKKTNDVILLFFKHYDPSSERLRYVGRRYVSANERPFDILEILRNMAKLADDENIDLFQEISFEPHVTCQHVDISTTFQANQLLDGDIICYQKAPNVGSDEQFHYPNVPSFLEYVHNRQVVRFRSLEKPTKEKEFSLELSKLHTYDDVVIKVAERLRLNDPSKIRLWPYNCYLHHKPSLQPIKYQGVEHLSDMLMQSNETSDILYYEILDIRLPELECIKTLKIAFHLATENKVVFYTSRFHKQSAVEDVLNDLKSKVNLSHPDVQLRLLKVYNHQIHEIFPLSQDIENISHPSWELRAEEVPAEEQNLGPHDQLIRVSHFVENTVQNHVYIQNFGDPFYFVIHEGETLADVKLRIQERLQVPNEEFSEWKFAYVFDGHPEYLQDSDIVSVWFKRMDGHDSLKPYLGVEHADNAPIREGKYWGLVS